MKKGRGPPIPLPGNEAERLKALARYRILDTESEQDFDDLALLASLVCGTPVGIVSLLDRDRQWFKARVGTTVSETTRDIALCAHGILQSDVFIVPDAATDPRFAANPLVTGEAGIRFYAGAPLLTAEGYALGMVCVTDRVPRNLSPEQQTALVALSRQAVARMDAHRSLRELQQTVAELERAQGELAWKTAFLEAQTNAASDGILVVDSAGRKILQNQRAIDLLKLPQHIAEDPDDEAQLQWVRGMMKHPEAFDERVARLYAHPEATSHDEMELKDGTVLERYSSPVRGANGVYYGRIWTFHDITARQQSELALRESEARYRALFGNMLEGYAFCRLIGDRDQAEDFVYLEVNSAFETLTGLKDVVGKRVSEVIPGIRESDPELFEIYHRVAATGRPEKLEKYLQAMGIWFAITVYSNDPGHFVAIFENITKRKQAEESLLLLHSAVQQTQESIVITDAELDRPGPRILFVNPAFTRMRRCQPEDVIGKSPRIFQGPRTDRAVLRRLRNNLERGEGFEGEAVNYRLDGTEFDLEWQIAPIRDPEGKITHFVAAERDITARKQAQAELEETHRQLVEASRRGGMAEVATSVLHNVGTVLNSVNTSTNVIAERVKQLRTPLLANVAGMLAEHAPDLGAFLTNNPRGQQIPAFLAQLSEHLRTEQGAILQELGLLQGNIEHIKVIVVTQQDYATLGGARELLAVASVVDDGIRVNEDNLGRHCVAVVREYAPVPRLLLEKHKLLQIMVNLVRNARNACTESGREDPQIIVRVAMMEAKIRIAVTDNGVGIPPENLPRIFTHGFTTRRGGHGFGLHGCALAARDMGGSLRVESDGAGRGATFTLELPVNQPETTLNAGQVPT